jgi:hypothetical protein
VKIEDEADSIAVEAGDSIAVEAGGGDVSDKRLFIDQKHQLVHGFVYFYGENSAFNEERNTA